jgi:hypothetical protein
MKVKAFVHLGLAGCTCRESIEIDDDELGEMSEDERGKYIDEIVRDWMFEQIEWGWEA